MKGNQFLEPGTLHCGAEDVNHTQELEKLKRSPGTDRALRGPTTASHKGGKSAGQQQFMSCKVSAPSLAPSKWALTLHCGPPKQDVYERGDARKQIHIVS